MNAAHRFPPDLQNALDRGVQKRLPLTFLPFVNEQLRRWEFLFPNERRSVEHLLLFVDGLTPTESSTIFYDVIALEEKMGVRHWQFSAEEQTILNSSQLARSPYFQEWRKAVQAVFDGAEKHAAEVAGAANVKNRLVLLNLPRHLPVTRAIWDRWQGIGKQVTLDLSGLNPNQTAMEALLASPAGLLKPFAALPNPSENQQASILAANAWVIDAGRSLVDAVVPLSVQVNATPDLPPIILLSYERLDSYRSSFSHEMNTMRKDLADADAVFDRLRRVDVTPWCPPEVAASAAVREYVRSVYLSGNGAVIFGNSFVEWCASEAFRRARPAFLAAQFGTRARPKAFTGVAVFDNPDQINPTPSVDDLPGSALDAEMLSLYVWLAASRYSEYQAHTVCICIAESVSQAYVVAPPDTVLLLEREPVKLSKLGDMLRDWTSASPV